MGDFPAAAQLFCIVDAAFLQPGRPRESSLIPDEPQAPAPAPPEQAAPPPVATFLLTSLQDPAAIVAQHRRTATTTVQICDRLAPEGYALLRREMPGIGLVQVVHVEGPEAVDEAVAVAPRVDAILLDSGRPSLQVKELGGTGRRHDWSISRRIREAVPVPLFLAGGLTADNVAEAVEAVRPPAGIERVGQQHHVVEGGNGDAVLSQDDPVVLEVLADLQDGGILEQRFERLQRLPHGNLRQRLDAEVERAAGRTVG